MVPEKRDSETSLLNRQKYRDRSREAEASTEYWTDVAISDFVRELTALMKERQISNAELARRMGVERQYISKLLGGANVTLGTMVKLGMALDAVVRVRLEKKEERGMAAEESEASVVVDFLEPIPRRKAGSQP